MATEKKSDANKNAPRITDQFHKNGGTVYDLRCESARLTLFISPRSNPDDKGDWRVEAWSGSSPSDNIVAEWGSTRAEALRNVADFWTAHRAERGLPPLDWEGVEKALGAVRGI